MAQKSLPPATSRGGNVSRGGGLGGVGRSGGRGGQLPNLAQRSGGAAPHPNRAPRQTVQQMVGNRRRTTFPTAPRAGGTIALGNVFEGGGNTMRGNGGQFKCKQDGCNAMMMPGIDDMYGTGSDGPYCKEHWADMWVEHPMYNRPNMPMCKVGVRWTEQEWGAIQKLVADTVQDFLSPVDKEGRPRANWQPRYPRVEEMNQLFEKSWKRSVDCPFCKAHVSFSITCDDLSIPGVNAAAQQ